MLSLSRLESCWFWQPSLRLSYIVIALHGLAAVAVWLAAVPGLLKLFLLCLLCGQMGWQLYCLRSRQQPARRQGVRHTAQGWQVWQPQHGWRAVQLRADSMALPSLVLLRYKYAHQWFYRSALIAADSLEQQSHRRLRVRLKFSRQRWQAVK